MLSFIDLILNAKRRRDYHCYYNAFIDPFYYYLIEKSSRQSLYNSTVRSFSEQVERINRFKFEASKLLTLYLNVSQPGHKAVNTCMRHWTTYAITRTRFRDIF